ncbi:hypothetical protein CP987_19420, partial [Morganella morganii]
RAWKQSRSANGGSSRCRMMRARRIWKRSRVSMMVGQVATAAPKGFKKGATIDEEGLEAVEKREWWKFAVQDDARQADLEAVKGQYD